MNTKTKEILIKRYDSLQDYLVIWEAMRSFTTQRSSQTPDEIWLLQHKPVYTLGQAGKSEHLLNDMGIPLVKSDRGGQITYHGPGQLIVYLMLDLKRRELGVRELVTLMETSVIQLLQTLGITAYAKKSAPGVYVHRTESHQHIEHKIASLGLRVRRSCSYHGMALNIDMDLTPFRQINPCGYVDLPVTQLSDLLPQVHWQDIENQMTKILEGKLQ